LTFFGSFDSRDLVLPRTARLSHCEGVVCVC
jgi:hypothetical protein